MAYSSASSPASTISSGTGTCANLMSRPRERVRIALPDKERVDRSIAMTGRIFTVGHRRNLSETVTGLKAGFKRIVSLSAIRERHLPPGEAADLVATGKWRWGRRPWR
jgi:hypothetical protein